MKLLDKLKNALFEEEYVEVEEKPKKKPIKKEVKKVQKDIPKQIDEEKPIAKKIILPERNEVKVTTHEDIEEYDDEDDFTSEKTRADEIKQKHRFPMISDNEFDILEKKFEEPKVDYIEKPVVKEELRPYKQDVVEQHSKPYGIEDSPIKEVEYGAYEKKEERTYFKPSPIISPIYGILDKNYKKEEIVPKREVRLTSSYARENLDLDEVRKKAYGVVSTKKEEDESEKKHEDCTEESNLMDQELVDLTSNNSTPEIKKVTMGDAEEYFNDLGLEYNVDYQDGAKTKATGRRYNEDEDTDKNIEESKEIAEVNSDAKIIEEEKIEVPEEKGKHEGFSPVVDKEEYEQKKAKEEDNDDVDDDNLFDLIDSMYDKE